MAAGLLDLQMKCSRILRTSNEACITKEVMLGRRLPEAFRKWLLSNNGRGLVGLHVFPVLEPSDERKTWNSLARNQDWRYLDGEAALPGPRPLLTFAEYGTGDTYCFDYRSELVERDPRLFVGAMKRVNVSSEHPASTSSSGP